MTFNQRVEKAKPYLTGFVVGIIAAPVVAFSAGWISTTGARNEAVEMARIETLTSICTATASRLAAAQSEDIGTFKGYGNRVRRDELVGAAMADLLVPANLVTRVTSGCNRTLA